MAVKVFTVLNKFIRSPDLKIRKHTVYESVKNFFKTKRRREKSIKHNIQSQKQSWVFIRLPPEFVSEEDGMTCPS